MIDLLVLCVRSEGNTIISMTYLRVIPTGNGCHISVSTLCTFLNCYSVPTYMLFPYAWSPHTIIM